MKKLVAIVALGALLLGLAAPPAQAHGGEAALAWGAFALFNLLFLPFTLAAAIVTPPVVYSPPAPAYAYSAPAVSYSRPASIAPAASYVPARASTPLISREVVYAHGRYVLFGDGVIQAYQWIWVPNAPPPGSAPGY